MKQRNPGLLVKAVKSRAALCITHPNAAGIDIGSASHFVAVPPDRDEQPVREFASFTVDLHALADWLDACAVDTVAMESTGFTGYPCLSCLNRAASRRSWSTRAMSRMSRGASPTYWTASGCNNS